MSTNRSNNNGLLTNVSSDGQGHYVVYHQQQQYTPTQPTLVHHQQQLNQQRQSSQMIPPLPNLVAASTTTSQSRPRILTRPTPCPPELSKKSAPNLTRAPTPISIAPSPISRPQLVTSDTPEVVTIVEDESNPENVSTGMMNQPITIYQDTTPVSETMLSQGNVNYSSTSSLDNFGMNDITYMTTLSGGLDVTIAPGSVFLGSDNELYKIQPNGEAALLYPRTDDGSINLMPLIDTSSVGTQGQIHFPMGDVMSGNGVFEIITLPSDSTITSFTDQPILNLANTNFGNVLPMSQDQDQTQYVYSVDEHGLATVSTVGTVLHQNATATSVVDNSVLAYPVPVTSTVTSIAPSSMTAAETTLVQSNTSSQRTYITVVDDFSDLIKTDDEVVTNPWGFSGDSTEHEMNFGAESEQTGDASEAPLSSVGEGGMDGIDMTNEVIDSIQAEYNGDSICEVKAEPVRVMVDGEYFEEVEPTTDTIIIKDPRNLDVEYKLDSSAVSQLTPITLPNKRLPQIKVASPAKQQIRARPLPVLARKPAEPAPTVAVVKNLNDFTTITLRNSMEKATAELPAVPVIVEKSKVKVPARSSPPKNIRPISRLHPGVPTVNWVNGFGTFPGLAGKLQVNASTGLLEVLDYNPVEHQRKIRVPLKAVKEQPKVVKKIGYNTKSKSGSKKVEVSKIKTKTNPVGDMKPVLPDREVDVTFCISCGTLAKRDKEFFGKKCKSCCIEAELEGRSEDEENPVTMFKIPKGITIVKTSIPFSSCSSAPVKSKRLQQKMKVEGDESDITGDRKMPVLKLEPPLDSIGITVTPIFQTPSPIKSEVADDDEDEDSSDSDSSSPAKKQKYKRRSTTQKRKSLPKKLPKGLPKKRTLERVLSTKTKHAKRSLLGGSSSSVSDAKSPGPPEHSSEEEMNNGESDTKKRSPLIEFMWTKYLQETNSKAAPPRFFRQPAFPPPNPFKIGMMLEAVDPQHQSLFCVASVLDVQGYRIRLHLSGYSEIFDFWVNSDSYEIFPVGWCAENGHDLEPPPSYESFSWEQCLRDEVATAADPEFFAISKDPIVSPQDIKKGMKLEAVDVRNMNLTCVATVENIINDRILIHFDSWDCVYDYWTDTASPYIHPVGYCKKIGIDLTPPKNYKGTFQWETYLTETDSEAVPTQAFHPLPPIGFKKGMKLECVDKRNPFLIRVATIVGVEDHQLTIHFDGWYSDYDFEVYECSPDIHPASWCLVTGHPLQVPPDESEPWSGSCSVFGCLGLGHIKGYKFMTHNTEVNCPYSTLNLKKDFNDLLPDRFLSYKKSVIVTAQHGTSSRRGSVEPQTTFQRAAKLRSEKRKLLEKDTETGAPPKRKYTKKSESDVVKRSSEDEEPESLLMRRLSSRRLSLPSTPASTLSMICPDLPKHIVLPNIESTITPLPHGGAMVQVHWEDSVAKRALDSVVEQLQPSEFSLPPSTTMTPIPTPFCSSSSVTLTPVSELTTVVKTTDHLLMISQKTGGELTISQCSSDSSNDPTSKQDVESEIPLNYEHNIRVLVGIVGKLSCSVVSKWKTKNVVGFVRKLPGCLEAARKFDTHQIDGEAFLLMTMTDFVGVLGLKMGPSIKLFQAVRLVHKNTAGTALPAISITPIACSTVVV